MTEQKKKRVQSKSKGNRFELSIAKELSQYLAPLTFIRTPGSGARVGGVNFEKFGTLFGDVTKAFVGDVVCTNEESTGITLRFNLELKSYKASDSLVSMLSDKALLFAWLKESAVDAKKVSKSPLLIFKFNRTETMIAVDMNEVLDLDKHFVNQLHPALSIQNGTQDIRLFKFDEVKLNKQFWQK